MSTMNTTTPSGVGEYVRLGVMAHNVIWLVELQLPPKLQRSPKNGICRTVRETDRVVAALVTELTCWSLGP